MRAPGEHVGGHVEHAEKRSGEQFSDDGDDHAADQGGDDGRVHGVAHRFAAASSDGVGDDDVRAESDADEQVEDESGDGRVEPTAATAAVPSDWEKLPTIMMPDALKSCSRMPVAATGSANRRTFVHMRPCSMSMPCLLCTMFCLRQPQPARRSLPKAL